MKAKACSGAGNSAVSYIADLTTELAIIAAAEGHQHLAQILHMAHREAKGLRGETGRGTPESVVDRGYRRH